MLHVEYIFLQYMFPFTRTNSTSFAGQYSSTMEQASGMHKMHGEVLYSVQMSCPFYTSREQLVGHWFDQEDQISLRLPMV